MQDEMSATPATPGLVILVVDDDTSLPLVLEGMCPEVFEDRHTLVQAKTVADAVPLWRDTPKVDVVLLDGCIPSDPGDGLRAMRALTEAGCQGPFIAISSSPAIRNEMVRAGCAAGCDTLNTERLWELIEELTEWQARPGAGSSSEAP
jgi:CheY-like chemotaxis protein